MAILIAKRMYLTGPGSETGVLGGDSNICIMTAFMSVSTVKIVIGSTSLIDSQSLYL